MISNDYPLTLLFDGACPVCKLEMDGLRDRDALRRLAFVDVRAPGFDVARHAGNSGATLEDMLASIHGVRPDGSMVRGVETLQLAYRAVGMGAWVLPTQLPLFRPLVDRAYAAFARNRYAVSAAFMPLIERIAARRAVRRMQACSNGTCEIGSNRGTS